MPQPSFFRLAFKQFWLLFGSIWFFVGSIFAVVGAGMAWNDWRYDKQGVVVEATVVRTYTTTGSKGSRYYYVEYQFTAQDGHVRQSHDKVDRNTWQDLARGSKIRIQYLPSNPDSNRIPQSSNLWGAIGFSAFGGVFGGIGGFLFFRGLNRVRTVQRLLREGVRIEGTVVSVEESSISVNRVRQWVVKYSYRDHMGQTHEAKSDYMSPGEASKWNEGDKGAVRIDQNQPEVCYWVGREESS